MTEPRQLPPEFRRRRPWPTTEMQRVLATEHHSTRGLLLRVAEDAPHPTGRAAAAVVAGARRKRARGGAGVPDLNENGAPVHGETSGGSQQTPDDARSTNMCSAVTDASSNNDELRGGGMELSATTGLWPRGQKRPGKKGETTQGLTASPLGGLVGSKMSCRGRIDDGDRRGRRLKKAAVWAFGGVRRRVCP